MESEEYMNRKQQEAEKIEVSIFIIIIIIIIIRDTQKERVTISNIRRRK